MTRSSCQRLFEAEAMRDGRLAGAELASFQRHIVQCPVCQQEVNALRTLGEALRAQPVSDVDELHVRRQRTRLLAALGRQLVAPERRLFAVRWMAVPLVFAALVSVVLVWWHVRSAARSVAETGAVVRSDGNSRWSTRSDGLHETIVLERGALWIHVEHGKGSNRLLVVLPDGELQDTGTTFSVSAEQGRTTHVAVSEGSVLLRLHGRPPIALGPGEMWAPPSTPSKPSNSPPAPTSVASVSSAVSVAPVAASRRGDTKVDSGTPQDPARDFRAAFGVLNSGESARAAAAFATFLAHYPRDRRAEDACYLRVIALQRAGDSSLMKTAAEEYLRRYPSGFRRAEVEAVLQKP